MNRIQNKNYKIGTYEIYQIKKDIKKFDVTKVLIETNEKSLNYITLSKCDINYVHN